MHLLTQSTAADANDHKRMELGTLADEVLGYTPRLKWGEFREAILAGRDCTKRIADNRINAMLGLQVVKKSSLGFYEKGQP